MERIASEVKYEGRIATVRVDRFRYEDGSESDREIVAHPGAVGIIAYDDEFAYLVRQPREAVGERALLEVPAGKLDVEGESPLECAQRELVDVEREAHRVQVLARLYGLYQELTHAVAEATTLTEEVLPEMTRALETTRYAYERGRYGFLEWLDAQRERIAVERARIEASANAHLLRAEIERLTDTAVEAATRERSR